MLGWLMSYKGCGKKTSCPYMRNNPGVFLELLRETMRNFGQVRRCPDQDSNQVPSEHKWEIYHLSKLAPLKRWWRSTRLHGFTVYKTIIFMVQITVQMPVLLWRRSTIVYLVPNMHGENRCQRWAVLRRNISVLCDDPTPIACRSY
jgi:hypothetical protein